MTKLQTLQIRKSEISEKLNSLLGLETRTEEQDGELVKLTAEGQRKSNLRFAPQLSPVPRKKPRP